MNVKELVKSMSLLEKAQVCTGRDFWHLMGYEKYGIPAMMVTDGPHGLRKQAGEADHLGMNESIEAVCFPAGCALASSFDRELAEKLGQTLGNECQAENVGIILGPGVNIKRSPLCGRNFEYLSEDPYIASEMAAAYIRGVQSKGVGTSVKHFFANNQEKRRMNSSSEMSERTAREIYLAAFEGAVKKSQPWSIMCSYNQINGVYSAENEKYLTEVLRKEWGFEGFVVSDWGAANNVIKDIAAGMDLEMPAVIGSAERIAKAVEDGELSESALDQAAERVLRIVARVQQNRDESAVFDRAKDHELARSISAECMVLLKNEGALPLKKDAKVLFVGEFAQKPRYQGGGSSHIHASKVESALEMAPEGVSFCLGFEANSDEVREELVNEALKAAETADAVVVFAGLPDRYESEGYDRTHMRLPHNQNDLIAKLAKVNRNIVVVLHNGSPVELPWIGEVNAVLEAYLGGEAVGGAVAQVLYGEVNPSGHLSESFPLRLQDTPTYLWYGGEKGRVEYPEGVFVGYRYYDSKNMDVLFPFGHGLSYTSFAFSSLTLDRERMKDSDTLTVSVDVTNTGSRFGKEVVQLYVAPGEKEVIRPVHELKRFEKITLEPGETKTVVFELGKRDFAYYEEQIQDWYVETGDYTVEVGNSSRNLPLRQNVFVEAESTLPVTVTLDTPMSEVMKNPVAQAIFGIMMSGMANSEEAEAQIGVAMSAEMLNEMMKEVPLRSLAMFSGGQVTFEQLNGIVEMINAQA